MIRAPKSEANELARQRHETRSSLLPTLKTRGPLIQAKRSCAFCPPLPVHERDYSGLLKNRTNVKPEARRGVFDWREFQSTRSAVHPVGFRMRNSSNASFLAASPCPPLLHYRLPGFQSSVPGECLPLFIRSTTHGKTAPA